jgi:predicted solute-binding protein
LDLQTNKNLEDLISKLDEQIKLGPHDLDEYFEGTNYQIKNNAQELFKLVYDID